MLTTLGYPLLKVDTTAHRVMGDIFDSSVKERLYQAPFKSLFGLITIAFAVAVVTSSASAGSHRGVVATRLSGCDYFLIKTTDDDYTLVEYYSGHDPESGDIVSGVLDSYGTHDLRDVSADESIHVYVEEYGLDRDDAEDKLNAHC